VNELDLDFITTYTCLFEKVSNLEFISINTMCFIISMKLCQLECLGLGDAKKCDIVKETLLNHLFDIVLLQKQNHPPSILSI
jgi:hypothetical protein